MTDLAMLTGSDRESRKEVEGFLFGRAIHVLGEPRLSRHDGDSPYWAVYCGGCSERISVKLRVEKDGPVKPVGNIVGRRKESGLGVSRLLFYAPTQTQLEAY
jgi:hypothetical protein